ncbi:hypothetical protein M9458_052102, partial [Cirrhinus mrigala]
MSTVSVSLAWPAPTLKHAGGAFTPPETTHINDNPFSSLFSFDDLRESVRQLSDKLDDFCKEELKKISDRGK